MNLGTYGIKFFLYKPLMVEILIAWWTHWTTINLTLMVHFTIIFVCNSSGMVQINIYSHLIIQVNDILGWIMGLWHNIINFILILWVTFFIGKRWHCNHKGHICALNIVHIKNRKLFENGVISLRLKGVEWIGIQ